jgi:hypothetical protein
MRSKYFAGCSDSELRLFARLDTPAKVQNFLETVPINFELDGETCRSPRQLIKTRRAHCFEGAAFAAAVFLFHARPPLLMQLFTKDEDDDHAIAPFRVRGFWGAISTTNHAVLRYREPVYASPRELAMSYFHEYFLHDGKKTMVAYSPVLDVRDHAREDWIIADEGICYISHRLMHAKRIPCAPKAALDALRKADPREREAGKLTRWSAG